MAVAALAASGSAKSPIIRPPAYMALSPSTSPPVPTPKTDRWSGYPGAPVITHDPHVVVKMAAHIVLPWVRRIFSNLKVWALGVYHGLRRQHLQSYLDEFGSRFNRRRPVIIRRKRPPDHLAGKHELVGRRR
jgi:hypothetical protein